MLLSIYLGLAILVVVFLGLILYISGSLDISGTIAGCIIGAIVLIAGGYRWFLLLALFVVLGNLSTYHNYKEKLESGITHGKRTIGNVLANGGIPCISAIIYNFVSLDILAIAFVGSLASATADTLSSEIGSIYGEPRLLTTLEKVPRGTEGGVSLEGEIAAIIGCLFIAITGFILDIFSFFHILTIILSGLFGTHIDSFLGATIEGKKIGNHTVNFIACSSGAIIAIIVFHYIN